MRRIRYSFLIFLLSAFLVGCNSSPGEIGPQGPQGEQGEAGPKGDQGETGPQGPSGANGKDGEDGSSFLSGSGVPSDDLGNVGDSYLDTNNGDCYTKNEDGWVLTGNIKGATGSEGKSSYDLYVEQYPGYTWGQEQWVKDLASNKLAITIEFETFGGTSFEPINCFKGEKISIDIYPEKAESVFLGWYLDDSFNTEAEMNFVAEKNLVFYAKYKTNQYEITWIIDDEETKVNYDFGSVPVYPYETPTKDDELYSYSFTGWSPEITPVSGPTSYLAQFEKELKGYTVTFVTDSNTSVSVFKTQNYTEAPFETELDYSRNSSNGSLDKTGNGQCNFILSFIEGYIVDEITISGSFKNLKDSTDTGIANLYRITKISSDLIVTITTKNVENSKILINVGSQTSDTGLLHLIWNYSIDIDHLKIEIEHDSDTETEILNGSIREFDYQLYENESYRFTLTPYYTDLIVGQIVSINRSFSPLAKNKAFPKVELKTKDLLWPSVDYVQRPTGTWGWGTTNKQYVQSSFTLSNSSGTAVYSSEDCLDDALDIYSGSKIKVRGNSSAYYEKKPYKLKLNESVDLLSYFDEDREVDSSYSSNEWVLLACGNSLQTFFGREISSFFDDGYDMGYQYVSLFLNGDYRGLYILADAVEKPACGVNESGYIVENDAVFWNESLSFETTISSSWSQMAWTFKYPDPDEMTTELEEVAYIQNYISTFETKVLEHNSEALDYIDLTSFMKWTLIHDLIGTEDSSGSNIYVVKQDNLSSLLKAGPVWDFDSAFDPSLSNRFCKIHSYADGSFHFIIHLFELDDVKEEYFNVFHNYCSSSLIDYLFAKYNTMHSSAFEDLLSLENSCFDSNSKSISDQYDLYIDFISDQMSWISPEIDSWHS